jgi:hypothetical protein
VSTANVVHSLCIRHSCLLSGVRLFWCLVFHPFNRYLPPSTIVYIPGVTRIRIFVLSESVLFFFFFSSSPIFSIMKASLFAGIATFVAGAFSYMPPPISPSISPLNTLQRPRLQPRSHPNPEVVGNGTFTQLLDHADPSKGSFTQRYWWNADYWAGPGSPVFLLNAGEIDASLVMGFLNNDTLPGKYAQLFKGAVILIEHRYWGQSIPFAELTAETLQYLSLPQAIADNTYFAKNVDLPFDTTGGCNADKAPWVLMGGSYPGALAAWTQQIEPGVFWAYHASSAVVEAIEDFWTYYVPVEAALPRNCSADIKLVINFIDSVLASNNKTEVQALKKMFGIPNLNNADFAALIAQPIAQWQSNTTLVYNFCDYIETAHNKGKLDPSTTKGVGLNKALKAYAAAITYYFADDCATGKCDTYTNTSRFNNPTDVENDRQWFWLVCVSPLPPHASPCSSMIKPLKLQTNAESERTLPMVAKWPQGLRWHEHHIGRPPARTLPASLRPLLPGNQRLRARLDHGFYRSARECVHWGVERDF